MKGFLLHMKSFPDVWKDQTPVKGEEILEIDRYQERYIELVPNQNSLDTWGLGLRGKSSKTLQSVRRVLSFRVLSYLIPCV